MVREFLATGANVVGAAEFRAPHVLQFDAFNTQLRATARDATVLKRPLRTARFVTAATCSERLTIGALQRRSVRTRHESRVGEHSHELHE
jgi:hypothetical protein